MAAQQQQQGPGWFVEVTDQPLDLLKLTQLVTDPGAGAISTFIGTTRNNFDNKAVLHLEYEAYVPMAVAKLKVWWVWVCRPLLLRCHCYGLLRPSHHVRADCRRCRRRPAQQELCEAVQQKWQVTHVAMAHRTGTVKVCEASVIIAVSSPHRQAALQVRRPQYPGRCLMPAAVRQHTAGGLHLAHA
jgi:molybdopterin synthase catalytic subunit